MSILNKILLSITVFSVISSLLFVAYETHEIAVRQQSIEAQVTQQKELADGILRSLSSYTTKEDIEKFIKDSGVNLKIIQDDLSKFHAHVDAANVISIQSSGQKISSIKSTRTGDNNPNPVSDPDSFGFMKKMRVLDLHENLGGASIPFGWTGFSAWQPAPWDVVIYPRDYKVVSVIGTDENQKTYVYNKFSVKVNDKEYDVKITSSDTKQEVPTAKWTLFNPKLFISVHAGVSVNTVGVPAPSGQFIPSLSVGFITYGKYKNTPQLSVAQVGVGVGLIDKRPQLLITPVAYNIGQKLPFISNTYLGASISVGTSGAIGILGSVTIGL